MIRVIVYDKAHGAGGVYLYTYRVEGHWGPDGAPLVGIAENPLVEAARVLTALGVPAWTPIMLEDGKFRVQSSIKAALAYDPLKSRMALEPPKPRSRSRRRALVARGSGIPGDG